jgi:nitrile hydratase subunit beta
MMRRMEQSVNDIGGEDWGPVPLTQKDVPDWAKLSIALRGALGEKGARLVSLHEGRRAREEMGYERYHALGYFEMGMQAILDILVQKKIVTEQEVRDRIDLLTAKRSK